ncbi:frataxin homolog, mitochondrial [Coccinella septempunctata]|uniref:frataxin homolog, mitochondrial n=1 Tax=Coccinella septempunctata TaxID=41139 RepID=UPI001D075A05|nr:frataxin homolog, mitochondrial [Coccinella septempunctata]
MKMSIILYQNFIRVTQYFKRTLQFSNYTVINLGKQVSPISNSLISKKFQQIRSTSSLTDSSYEKICGETLESLSDVFEELQELIELPNADISYNDGVLTINLGKEYGTYVINRQLPNKQIWLSSPISGPKRYDYMNNSWIYKHNNQTLHSLLQEELSKLLNKPIDLSNCLHYKS